MAEKHSCTYVYGCFLLYHNLFISKIFGTVLTPFTPLFTYFGTKKGFRGISETHKITVLNNNYSMIVATAPEPTVLPPSRIFKKRFIVKVPIYLDLLYKYHLILFVLFHLFIFMVPY